MKIKALKEKRALVIGSMKAFKEERNFEEFNKSDLELQGIDSEIEAEQRMLALEKKNTDGVNPEEDEERETNKLEVEIRSAIESNDEVNLSDIEVRDGELVIGAATGTQASVGNIAKTTFAGYILQRLKIEDKLFSRCRVEILSGKNHAIPVQKKKLPKFVSMKELAKYAKEQASYEQIKLEATKFGTLVVISEECASDTGYDIVGDVQGQILQGYADTLAELIVTGEAAEKIDGLNSFVAGDTETSANKVVQETQGAITIEEIEAIYYALPKIYRKSATWVISDDTARILNGMKDANGRPLLKEGYNGQPFGEDSTLMNCPVVVNDSVANLDAGATGKGIFFGDLTAAIIVGLRRSLTLQKSLEYGWIEDSIAIKANVRLDIKKALEEALVYFELIGDAATKAKATKKK